MIMRTICFYNFRFSEKNRLKNNISIYIKNKYLILSNI